MLEQVGVASLLRAQFLYPMLSVLKPVFVFFYYKFLEVMTYCDDSVNQCFENVYRM